MPKIYYLIPIILGLVIAIGMQFYINSAQITESDRFVYQILGLAATIFLSSSIMSIISSKYKKPKQEEDYPF